MGFLDNVRKAFTVTPVEDYQIAAATSAEQNNKFSPGVPINPADGYSRTPRAHDFLTGYNIAARPRRNERVSFQTLQGLIDAYDIAQMAITHRIDSIRSLDWYVEPMEGYDDDAETTIAFAKKVLAKPDRELPFRAWLSKFLWDVLAYDAGTLYRMRNNAGQVIGLKVVDGTTIAPLIDYHGGRPTGEAAAYVQFAQGVPWNWLLDSDIVYVPFRPMPNSPYGKSPLESILLNANTDLRFQNYFLSRFTEGTVPEGFATAPESWGPDQIADFQDGWDAMMYGDESKKHQIKWVPGGTSFTWSQENPFQAEFSLFLMRKTAAAFHVTPNDLGFTDTVNLANGETQTEVQFRVGSLPLIQHVQDILTSFLQDDLGLPVNFRFDTGAEKDDRLMSAQIAEIMIRNGVISPSEVREDLYGLQEPGGVVIPRFVNSNRGPIPLANLFGASGPTDNVSGMPEIGAALPTEYTPVEGVIPESQLAKGEATPGFFATTGANASPLIAEPSDDEDDDNSQIDTKSHLKAFEEALKNPNESENGAGLDQDFTKAQAEELATFRRFVKARQRDGKWRDFNFDVVSKDKAETLNAQARMQLEPGDTELVALLAVVANTTGRILMLQRGVDPNDENAGKLDLPGGHVKLDETVLEAAFREFGEEIQPVLPDGTVSFGWMSEDKPAPHIGFVYSIESEDLIVPEGFEDGTAAVLWVNPKDLRHNPMVKPNIEGKAKEIVDAVGDAAPLVKGWRESANIVPQHEYDIALTDHYSPLVSEALLAFAASLPVGLTLNRFSEKPTVDKKTLAAQVVGMLGRGDGSQIRDVVREMLADGYIAGVHAAKVQIGQATVKKAIDDGVDWDNWKPGNAAAAAQVAEGGMADLLSQANLTLKGIESTAVNAIGDVIADGLGKGLPSGQIARNIRDSIGMKWRADVIAHTESTRGVTAATLDTYRDMGIESYDLLLASNACETCSAIAAAGPYPSTDTEHAPPIHPFCRCAASPVSGLGLDQLGGGKAPVETAATKPPKAKQAEQIVPAISNPVRLESVPEIIDYAKNNLLDVKTLEDGLRREIEYYTGPGAASINEALRTGKFIGPKGAAMKESVKALDKIMKVSTLPEDTIVTRMLDGLPMQKFLPKGADIDDFSGLAGKVLKDKGFMSTSLGAKPATGFEKSDIRLEITVPKGTGAVWVNPISSVKGERELILNRNTAIDIQEIVWDGRKKQWLAKAVVVPK